MRTLKVGMEVTIYQDPQTETKKEGQAVLLRKTLKASPTDDFKQELWFVRFPDGDRVDRWIRTV